MNIKNSETVDTESPSENKEAFMCAVLEGIVNKSNNPENLDRVCGIWSDCVDVEFRRSNFEISGEPNDRVTLYSIHSQNPKGGLGSQFMEWSMGLTDKFGVNVYVLPSPFGDTLSKSELISWYERYGFEVIVGVSTDNGFSGYMKRTCGQ